MTRAWRGQQHPVPVQLVGSELRAVRGLIPRQANRRSTSWWSLAQGIQLHQASEAGWRRPPWQRRMRLHRGRTSGSRTVVARRELVRRSNQSGDQQDHRRIPALDLARYRGPTAQCYGYQPRHAACLPQLLSSACRQPKM